MRVLAALALVLAAVPAAAEPPVPGIYGNVQLSAETGDLGGMELALIGTGASAQVEFVLCEGWCNMLTSAPARFTDEGFEFEHVDQYWFADGSPAPEGRYRVQAIPVGTGLKVTVIPADNPEGSFSAELPRIDQRFGLAVAAGED